jgi:micrococcal nuclease
MLAKTPGMKIPGVFLCLLLPLCAFASCGQPSGQLLQVARVLDGDTLKLIDGRSVRLLGVNAPEIAHGQQKAQPFGRESRIAAQQFIDQSYGYIRLGFERELRDHYGRWLAHIYDQRGRSLAEMQLRKGMALQIAVPPNIAYASCFERFEKTARQQRLGVWREAYWQPLSSVSLAETDTGFRHIRGRITQVNINSAVWLEFEGKLVVRVGKKDWPLFAYKKADWLALKGREIELRGWIAKQKSKRSSSFKPLSMQLRSPSSMKVIAK